MNVIKQAALLLAGLWLGAAQAGVGPYKVVLVHGFQPGNLASQPNANQVAINGEDYWREYWLSRADARIDWPSQFRIRNQITTDYVWPKLQQLAKQGTCQPGCIFVTHSTGDLVTRYILDNQANWLSNAGLQPLNIVATLDFAGAGGGSELADLAVGVAEGGSLWDATLRAALSLWLGQLPNSQNVGVLQDLKVNNARNLAPLPANRAPRLRFVGDASDYLGSTSVFIPGNDDGVVGSHSACGSASAGSFGSCSKTMAFNGKLESQSDGVGSLMPYHYPFLMAPDYSHGGTIAAVNKGKASAVRNSVTLANGSNMAFSSYQQTSGWWLWKATYSYVYNSDRDSLSQLVVNAVR